MDIRERIKNVIVKNLIEARLNEAKPYHPTDPADRKAYVANLEKEREYIHDRNNALKRHREKVVSSGPNTRRHVLGNPTSDKKADAAAAAASSKKS